MNLSKKTYKIVAILILLFGIIALAFSLKLPFGSFSNPKSGFVPVLFSSLLIFFAVINCILELRREDKEPSAFNGLNWKKWVLYTTDCFLFLILIKYLGYFIATTVSLFLMIKLSGLKSSTKSIIISVIFTLLSWFIFTYAMNINLPRPFFI